MPIETVNKSVNLFTEQVLDKLHAHDTGVEIGLAAPAGATATGRL
jgi:hypothetical protein